MSDDPLTALLRKAKLSDAQRAGLWDLFQAAKNEDDLASRLKALQLDEGVKADLWDLKAAGRPVTEPTKPSEGYWEDRGIGGKVWHPASGASERHRADNQVLGLPPEVAAIGAATVGAAALRPGLTAVGRVAAGAKAAAGQAVPLLKYEAARQGLRFVGVPEPIASIGAGVFAARGAGKATAADEAIAAEAAPVTVPKGDPAMLSPLELTRKLRAEHQAASGMTKMPEPEAVAREFKTFFAPVEKAAEGAARSVPKLKVQETAMAMKLLKGGMPAKEVMDTILRLREMPVSWRNLPTDAEVAAVVAAKNARP